MLELGWNLAGGVIVVVGFWNGFLSVISIQAVEKCVGLGFGVVPEYEQINRRKCGQVS